MHIKNWNNFRTYGIFNIFRIVFLNRKNLFLQISINTYLIIYCVGKSSIFRRLGFACLFVSEVPASRGSFGLVQHLNWYISVSEEDRTIEFTTFLWFATFWLAAAAPATRTTNIVYCGSFVSKNNPIVSKILEINCWCCCQQNYQRKALLCLHFLSFFFAEILSFYMAYVILISN